MNIKQMFEKIINFLTGKTSNEKKKLPVETSSSPKEVSEVSQRRGGFFNSLGKGIPVQETPNLEEAYNTALENYRKVFEEIEKQMAKMQILANNQGQIGEQDDPIEYAKTAKEKYIKNAGETEAKKEADELSGQDPRYTRQISPKDKAIKIHEARNLAKAVAEAVWMDKTAEYFNEALSLFIQSKIKERNGEKYDLSDDESIKIEIIQKVLQLLIEEQAIKGKLDGMRYAVLKHGLVDSKKAGIITRIDESFKFCEEFSSALRTLADERAIGVDEANKSMSMLVLDYITYAVNINTDRLYAGINEMYAKELKREKESWSDYIESGGVVHDAGMFEKDFVQTHEYFRMGEEEKKYAKKIIEAAKKYEAAKGEH